MAKWSDGNKFTLFLELVCRRRYIAACLQALTGNGRLMAKFPLRCCGHLSHTQTHTYTDKDHHHIQTCTCTHFLTVIYLPKCMYTQLQENPQSRDLLVPDLKNQQASFLFRNMDELMWFPQIVISGCYLVLHNLGKNGAGTYSRAYCIMYESGSMISTSSKLFPSIFKLKSCTIQGFIGTIEV